MAGPYTKKLEVTDGSNTVTLGGRQVQHDWKNKVDEEPLPQQNAGQKKTLALNMNRIKETFSVTALIDDEVASSLNSSTDDKETIKDTFITICESQSIVTLTYGSKTYKGYITQFNIRERAAEENWVYKIKFNFLRSQEMS